ncbi:hypothetical protein TIFTF001_025137 [Ficus carica]|uniref:Uncharacterized protein n=1 Tax=Ficus carica TaxID=3494 RepID=A0AA88AJ97_FICCA|nr:hypothetical protein TIFTF001_025137 [Ficus carica]
MNNQGWENNSTIMEPWYNTRPQHVESSPDLQALVAQFSEETKLRLEKLERMEVLRQLEAELAQIQVELSRMNAPTNDSIEAMKRKASMVDFYKELEASSQFHHDEPTPHEEERELFEDDSSREEETQDLYIDEESQEEVYESRPLEISIVMPPPINHNHIYVEWPAPPPPTLASFLHTHRAHPSK